MNLGLQDADNLAWKMSDVLGGHVLNPEKLLDSYSEEVNCHYFIQSSRTRKRILFLNCIAL